MKSQLRLIAVLLFLFILNFSFAQNGRSKAPRWVPNEGSWVVEQNENQPRHNIIRFYNEQHELIYTETLDGISLDVQRKKVKMKLKKLLENRIVSWSMNKTKETDKGYVAAAFR